jgi:hypothetical protein
MMASMNRDPVSTSQPGSLPARKSGAAEQSGKFPNPNADGGGKLKRLLTVLILSSVCLLAEAKPTKINITSSTLPTAAIVKQLADKCPNVGITRSEQADYSLEVAGGDRTNPHGNRLYEFTLFDGNGDVVFTTSTRQLHNAIKDVCNYINK